MTTFNVLSLFVGSATWLTALVGLLSLLTVKRQNRLTIKPLLTPIRQHVISRGEDHITSVWLEDDSAEPKDKKEEVMGANHTRGKNYAIRLFNLGGGAAKNITATWQIDIDNLVSQAQKLARKAFKDGYWEHNDNEMLSFKQSGGNQASYMISNCNTSHHGYILPCTIEHKGHEIALPLYYPSLVTNIVSLIVQQKDFDESEWHDFEKFAQAKLNLEYEDVPGNWYSAAFVCKLELYHFSSDGRFEGTLVPNLQYERPIGRFSEIAKVLRLSRRAGRAR